MRTLAETGINYSSRLQQDVVSDSGCKIVQRLNMDKFTIDDQKAGTFVYAPSDVERAQVVIVARWFRLFFTYKTAKDFFNEDSDVIGHILNSIKIKGN